MATNLDRSTKMILISVIIVQTFIIDYLTRFLVMLLHTGSQINVLNPRNMFIEKIHDETMSFKN